MSKKRLLFVVSTLNTGGAQRVMANLSLLLSNVYDIDFLLNDDENISFPFKGNILQLGFKPEKDKQKLIYQGKVFLGRLWKLYQLKKSGNYSACISALTSANAVNAFTGSRYCKTILTEHAAPSNEMRNFRGVKRRAYRWAIQKLYRRASLVVPVSRGIEVDLRDNYQLESGHMKVIYNGIDTERTQQLWDETLLPEKEQMLPVGAKIYCSMGRLEKPKAFVPLVHSFQKVVEAIPEAHLLILGEGSMREELEDTIQKCGLENKVTLLGFVDNPYPVLRKAYCLVQYSYSEGLPMALVEGMKAGLPVISGDCYYGPREILAPGTDVRSLATTEVDYAAYGILCPVKVPDNSVENLCFATKIDKEELLLAEAMIALGRDTELYQRYKEAASRRVMDFSSEEIHKQWEMVLNQ